MADQKKTSARLRANLARQADFRRYMQSVLALAAMIERSYDSGKRINPEPELDDDTELDDLFSDLQDDVQKARQFAIEE